jgi:hypothetical protein
MRYVKAPADYSLPIMIGGFVALSCRSAPTQR